jgi:PAS domain S-box-containing protein
MMHAEANEGAATRDHEPWAMSLATWFETLSLWARLTAAMAVVVVLTAALSRLGLTAALIAAPAGAVVAGMLARAMTRPSFAETERAKSVALPDSAGTNVDGMAGEALSGIPAEQMFRLAVEALPSGMILTNRTGTIVMLNSEVERLFGYGRSELIGQSVDILVPTGFRAQHVHRRADFLLHPASRRMGSGRDLFARRKDGTALPVEVALNPIATREGVLVLCAIADISERKRADNRKDEFVSTVSHELRTPLTSLAGSLGLLAGSAAGKLPDTAMRLLTIAHKNSQRLVRLINDILDIEKLESGEVDFAIKRVAVVPLVEQAIEASRAYGEGLGVTVRIDAASTAAEVRADPDRLVQVVTNLLSNANKFSPSGGEVVVSFDELADRVRIAVRDHGPGIPPEFKARVYEKFAQARAPEARQKGGTGLGLSIVKGIVTRLGGSTGFDDAPGGGTIFHVELPAWENAADAAADRTAPGRRTGDENGDSCGKSRAWICR